MSSSLLRAAAAALSLALLGACAHRQGPVYEESPTYSGSRVQGSQYGVVRAIDTVDARQSTTGGGAVLGGVIGAVVGRQFGGSGGGRAVGTVAGAVGGALVGNEIEKQQSNTQARYRVQVQVENGSMRTFNYAQVGDLRVGDRVRIEGQNLQRY